MTGDLKKIEYLEILARRNVLRLLTEFLNHPAVADQLTFRV